MSAGFQEVLHVEPPDGPGQNPDDHNDDGCDDECSSPVRFFFIRHDCQIICRLA